MGNLADAVKEMNREELEDYVIQWNGFMCDFERFIKEKVGRETYMKWTDEFCAKRASDWIRNVKIDSILYLNEDEEGELN